LNRSYFKKNLLILFVFVASVFFSGSIYAQVQDAESDYQYIRIAGTVVDYSNNRPIEFAALQIVSVDGTSDPVKPIGTVTDANGRFDFTFQFKAPYKIVASHISYQRTEYVVKSPLFDNIKIKMPSLTLEGDVIYVTSEIYPEDELSSTITTDRITAVDVEQVASFSAFDLVSGLREVDVATQSMNLKSVTTRGFNSSANPRFLQLTDGIDNVAPGLGFPVGDLLGPSELDIAGLELLVGPASARYGSNAMNGALLTKSLSPFQKEGISFTVKTGFHNLDVGGESSIGIESDRLVNGSVRIAKVFKDKLAFKITGTIVQGLDWRAKNYDNIGFGEPSMTRRQIAGYDGVNTYGDESFVYLPVGTNFEGPSNGRFAPVTRTGYKEGDLVDYDIETLKSSFSLGYRFAEDIDLNLEARYGKTNTLYTSDSRIRLQDFEMLQLKAEANINNFYVRGYSTSQYSGDSYNVNYLAEQLIQNAKSDANWYRDFDIIYQQGSTLYGLPAGDIVSARSFADNGATFLIGETARPRFEPGTEEFDNEVNRIINTVAFDNGAGIQDNSNLYHFEIGGTSNFSGFNFEYGSSYRFIDLDSGGSIFPDTTLNDITNYEAGGFVQFERSILDDRVSLLGAVRVDKNENFDVQSSQQIGITYKLSDRQFVRLSYNRGFRFPSVREQFLNTNLGKARLLGGLTLVTDPYELQGNALFEQSIDDFNQEVTRRLVESVSLGEVYSQTQAELLNISILQEGIVNEQDIQFIKPERVNAFELGFRQLFSDYVYLDLNYFLSFYDDFIGIKRIVKTTTSPSVDLFTSAGQVNSSLDSDRFYVYSNASELIAAHGVAFDLKYSSGNFVTGINGTLTTLIKSADDPIIPGYNTPPVKINFEWGNREIIENVGFKFAFKYRTEHEWESSFLDGTINSYGHFDAQFNIRMPRISSTLKTGVTNMGILSYYNVFGGPEIGSILFATFTYSPR